MDAQQVALIPECAECGQPGSRPTRIAGRRTYTDDEPPELAFYCPVCAEREFGDSAD